MKSSKSAVLHGARDLRIESCALTEPGEGEVLVRVAHVGVCGSDLAYFMNGRGSFSVVQEPLVLGHEASGILEAVGEGVDDLTVGTPVAIQPGRACMVCDECRAGRRHLCPDMRYLGSGASIPHEPGALTEFFIVRCDQLFPLDPAVDLAMGALAEPLAVALHALNVAGGVKGASVLVSGAGPIGLLTAAGALDQGAERVIVTDLHQHMLEIAERLGASSVLNVATDQGLEELLALEPVDLAFEASGSHQALGNCIGAVRRGGIVTQVGMPPMGPVPVDIGRMISKELSFRTSFRFNDEFGDAVAMLARQPSLRHLITSEFPLEQAEDALTATADRSQHCKVVIRVA